MNPRLSRLPSSGAASLNLAPLIDVVLLLLIFFMLTSPMVLQAALPEIDPPQTARPRAVDASADRIAIDAADRITFNGEAVSPEQLDARLAGLKRITVMADAAASLGVTVKVMDACAARGVGVDIYAVPKP